jgi:hypothetical protein
MTPTITPAPTLTVEEESEFLRELMATNGGCELPCWWGIMPGETKVETAREQLVAMGASWLEDNYASIGVNWGLSIQFEVSGGLVQSMNIGSSYTSGVIDRESFTEGWRRYSLMEMLNRHGVPTRVLVCLPFRADPGSGPSYHLLVFYENLGIEIEYRGGAEQLDGRRYRACPDLEEIREIGLFLYQPDQVGDVVERILPPESVSYMAGPDGVYELISWQQTAGSSLESFYETFSAQEERACFEFTGYWP